MVYSILNPNTIKMNWGLKDEQIKKIKNVFTRFKQIHEVILFGSRAKGNYKLGSDIDFAIKGIDLKLNDLLNLHNTLDDLDLPYKFDLFIFNQIEDKNVQAIRIGDYTNKYYRLLNFREKENKLQYEFENDITLLLNKNRTNIRMELFDLNHNKFISKEVDPLIVKNFKTISFASNELDKIYDLFKA